jgi:hypothetical protein
VDAPLEGGDQLFALAQQRALIDGARVEPPLHRVDQRDVLRGDLRIELDRLLDSLRRDVRARRSRPVIAAIFAPFDATPGRDERM